MRGDSSISSKENPEEHGWIEDDIVPMNPDEEILAEAEYNARFDREEILYDEYAIEEEPQIDHMQPIRVHMDPSHVNNMVITPQNDQNVSDWPLEQCQEEMFCDVRESEDEIDVETLEENPKINLVPKVPKRLDIPRILEKCPAFEEWERVPLRSCLAGRSGIKKPYSRIRWTEKCDKKYIKNTEADRLARLGYKESSDLMRKYLRSKKSIKKKLTLKTLCLQSNASISTVDLCTELRMAPPPDVLPMTPWKPQFRTSSELNLTGHQKGINKIKFSPNGMFIASASNDGTVKIWSFENQAQEHTLIGHARGVTDVTWHPSSKFVLSCSYDRQVLYWNLDGGAFNPDNSSHEVSCLNGHQDIVWCCAIDPVKGRYACSGSLDRTVMVWDLEDPSDPLYELKVHKAGVVSIVYHKDGRTIASAGADGHVLIWDTYQGRLLHSVMADDPARQISPGISQICYVNDYTAFLISTFESRHFIIDIQTRKETHSYVGHENQKRLISAALMTSSHRPLVISGSEKDRVCIWDMNTQDLLQSLPAANTGYVLAIDIHPTKNILATACASMDDTVIRVWMSP
ncbi:hypothetical protein L596_012816 [Steinernema carpocapsae]|nr:hypothetical protein L596_012816 [Steinernema carpocapsae]